MVAGQILFPHKILSRIYTWYLAALPTFLKTWKQDFKDNSRHVQFLTLIGFTFSTALMVLAVVVGVMRAMVEQLSLVTRVILAALHRVGQQWVVNRPTR